MPGPPPPRSSTVGLMQWWRLGVPIVALTCGDRFAPSPFASDGNLAPDAGAGAPSAAADAGGIAGPAALPNEVLGGPCVDDAQCDDGIDCTSGVCDPGLGLCRYVADGERCGDGVYCNGVERCDPRIGCVAGAPTSCSDSTPCTIDRCDEATRTCVHVERDVDGDGDVDGNCRPGADCNDLDPRVASTAPELCGNLRDDDCDGEIDEADCQLPEFDACPGGLAVGGPGSYLVSPAGTVLDYGAACATESPSLRDLVLLIEVPEGNAPDLDIVARTPFGSLALAEPSSCGAAAAPSQCVRGAQLQSGEGVARLHLYSPAPGVHAVYLYTDANADIQVDVGEAPASVDAPNVSCELRSTLAPGTSIDVDLATAGAPLGDAGAGLESACTTDRSDRFFEFSIDEVSDVRLVAESLDGLGEPRVSVRTDDCGPGASELRCNQRDIASTRLRALAPGAYVVAVSATGPTRARLSLDVRAPTEAPATDRCDAPPALAPNRTEVINFEDLDDDIAIGCSPGSVDTARRLDLDSTSDVLLVARFSPGDIGAVALSQPSCLESDSLGCSRTADQLARVSRRGLPAGEYRVVTESLRGLPSTLLAAIRPTSAPTLVPGSEGCADPLTIDPSGGFYQGNTGNAAPDLSASCDFATPIGAPDQLLRLVLAAPHRVVFDMRGSDFDTLLDVRRGPACPGEEVPQACAVFSAGERSFLDLDLPAGDYFVQIDGYAGASGNWFLNVFVLDP
jgi:Putative metal-binding motif